VLLPTTRNPWSTLSRAAKAAFDIDIENDRSVGLTELNQIPQQLFDAPQMQPLRGPPVLHRTWQALLRCSPQDSHDALRRHEKPLRRSATWPAACRDRSSRSPDASATRQYDAVKLKRSEEDRTLVAECFVEAGSAMPLSALPSARFKLINDR
jgi:hypothetical protein